LAFSQKKNLKKLKRKRVNNFEKLDERLIPEVNIGNESLLLLINGKTKRHLKLNF
jgi:hypothetical protein